MGCRVPFFNGGMNVEFNHREEHNKTYFFECPECGKVENEVVYYAKFESMNRIHAVNDNGVWVICYHCGMDFIPEMASCGLSEFTISEMATLSDYSCQLSYTRKDAVNKIQEVTAEEVNNIIAYVALPLEEWIKLFPEGETDEEEIRGVKKI